MVGGGMDTIHRGLYNLWGIPLKSIKKGLPRRIQIGRIWVYYLPWQSTLSERVDLWVFDHLFLVSLRYVAQRSWYIYDCCAEECSWWITSFHLSFDQKIYGFLATWLLICNIFLFRFVTGVVQLVLIQGWTIVYKGDPEGRAVKHLTCGQSELRCAKRAHWISET